MTADQPTAGLDVEAMRARLAESDRHVRRCLAALEAVTRRAEQAEAALARVEALCDAQVDYVMVHALRAYLAPRDADTTETAAEPTCICPRFSDTGGFHIADLCCPVHGANGADPGDGYWDDEADR